MLKIKLRVRKRDRTGRGGEGFIVSTVLAPIDVGDVGGES